MPKGDDRDPAAGRYDFCPWLFWTEASESEHDQQRAWQQALRAHGLTAIGERSFVSPLAAVYPAALEIGADSYIAAHVYLTDDVVLGDHTTLNPYATVRGRVRLGDGVRVGAYTSILGFNHTMDASAPVHRQPLVTEGISIGGDVWIGSHAIVLDGVTIGAHSVIGAAAVVTRDVPPWSVMVGNPARRVRDRREAPRTATRQEAPRAATRQEAPRTSTRRDALQRFAERARAEAAAVLDRCTSQAAGPRFVNQPGRPATVRATCDAVEVSAMLLGCPPPSLPAAQLPTWLAGLQDPDTGLVAELGPDDGPGDPAVGMPLDVASQRYHILAVGYALQLLGTGFRHPIHTVADLTGDALVSALEALPWSTAAWACGDWVDGYATGLYWNQVGFGVRGPMETLFGWLHLRQDRWSGLWGSPSVAEGWRQPVNGSYRLTRGTFAQFGVPVPNPAGTIDSVLAHTRDIRFFGGGKGTACDVLDVIHPLWRCGQQTAYRREEVRAWAAHRLEILLPLWRPGAGFAFDLGPGSGAVHEPSLMGTEMWLAIGWLLADVLDESEALGFRPQGVHRPEPAFAGEL